MTKSTTWLPNPGQPALIEVVDAPQDERPLTGIVTSVGDGNVVLDLGASPRPPGPEVDVVVSFFAPDALYKLSGTAVARTPSLEVLDLHVGDVERVQRRAHPRRQVSVPVSLGAFDGPGAFSSATGETVDLGKGGCRVTTETPFPLGADPTVSIRLPGQSPVVALARILEADVRPGRCLYRLAFADLSDEDAERVSRFVDEDAEA